MPNRYLLNFHSPKVCCRHCHCLAIISSLFGQTVKIELAPFGAAWHVGTVWTDKFSSFLRLVTVGHLINPRFLVFCYFSATLVQTLVVNGLGECSHSHIQQWQAAFTNLATTTPWKSSILGLCYNLHRQLQSRIQTCKVLWFFSWLYSLTVVRGYKRTCLSLSNCFYACFHFSPQYVLLI